MPTEPRSDDFRWRARAEAARYGSDPWVFVRELLQNSRDAGAGRVEIEVSRHGSRDRVTCRDDGCGMSYEHARGYLFALYASSKEDSLEQAGKFGIGFWSVLRFEPSLIVIRSRGERGDAWQVSIDGSLEHVEAAKADLGQGTEVVLERPAREGEDLAEQVLAAIRLYGRFVTRRGDPRAPLPVTVNNVSANQELALPPPSAAFRGKGFRGVVGLGPKPEVELFAQGLFVRSAPSLQDLRAAGELYDRSATEDVLAELPSLAPRLLIDSAELDLLLARSDARYDKHLRRILRTAERQLGRLITRQLQALRPQPFYRLWLGALRDRLEPYLGWHLAAATLIGLVLGAAVLMGLPAAWLPADWLGSGGAGEELARRSGAETSGVPFEEEVAPDPAPRPRPGESSPPAPNPLSELSEAGSALSSGQLAALLAAPGAVATGRRKVDLRPYFDLADRYRGPSPGGLAGDRSRLAMVYQPALATPFFAALVVDQLAGTRWLPSPAAGELPRYPGSSCRRGCFEMQLLVAAGQETLRLPVPTGHRLDPSSVRLDGRRLPVFETASGEALLRRPAGDREGGVVEYLTGPETSPRPVPVAAVPADAPAELVRVARKIRRRPVADRVRAALDFVAERVVYDRSPAAGRHYRLAGDEKSFVDVALAAGAGDCDVQSGVLVTLLRLAGVEARLALGYVGVGGTVAPGLHAWTEYRDPDAGWSVADASVTAAGAGDADPSLARLPVEPGSGGVRFPGGIGRGLPATVPLAAAALLLAGVAWALRRRSAAGIELGPSEDLAALLGGALRHPEAFAGLPAMFHGRFVPLLGRRGAISLARARRLGRGNRLFRSSTGSELARRAAARGVPMIDASTEEGRVLSLALGAIDVDQWSRWLERGAGDGGRLGRRVHRRLEDLGALFRLREVSGLPQPWLEIALEDLRLGRRQILFDPSHLEYAPVRALLEKEDLATAAFTLLDVLLHRIELPERERARLLAGFAEDAVGEAAAREEVA